MDSFPKKTLIVALFIVVIVVLLSAMGTAAFSSLFYQGVPDDSAWTPAPTRTPTKISYDQPELSVNDLSPTAFATTSILPTATFSMNCTYPAEYWIEHSELWPDHAILGKYQYSNDDIQKIIDNRSILVRDDLVLQMYFAYLNIQNNAERNEVEEILDNANSWLNSYANVYPLSDDASELGVVLAGLLGEFNIGLTGPGPCQPYQSPTRTPVGIRLTLTALATPTASVTPTRFFITVQPTATLTPTATRDDVDKPRWPTNTPRPVINTSTPPDTSTPQPPPATEAPTSAPPENTSVPTQPPAPTDPPQAPTPTPAS